MANKPKLYCLVAASGAGKSSLALKLSEEHDAVICSADHYFFDSVGQYNFDPSKLGQAHQFCYEKATKALQEGKNVIIDNTNAKAKDRGKYLKLAEFLDAEVEFLEPSTPWVYDLEELFKRNTKKTPKEVIEKQLKGVLEFKKQQLL